MAGHTPWSEIRLKVNDRLKQNGSRIGEHRKRSVPATNWMVLIGIICAVLALGATLTKGQEYEPFNAGTGLVVAQAEMCFAPEINADTIKLLKFWQGAVDKLETWERTGVPTLNEEDALLAQLLYDNNVCHTMKEFYPVVVIRRAQGYALAKFDEQLGFDAGPFIVRAQDVLPDRGI